MFQKYKFQSLGGIFFIASLFHIMEVFNIVKPRICNIKDTCQGADLTLNTHMCAHTHDLVAKESSPESIANALYAWLPLKKKKPNKHKTNYKLIIMYVQVCSMYMKKISDTTKSTNISYKFHGDGVAVTQPMRSRALQC